MESLIKLQEIESTKVNLANRLKEVGQLLELKNKELLAHYHILEDCTLDAVKFTKIAYRLRNILRERRELKEEQIVLDSYLNKSVKLDRIIANKEGRDTRYPKESADFLKSLNL